jgi:hypothetical protein
MTDERLKPGHCHKCGLPLSDNPHPEAGKPPHYLQVGCPKECIPCLTLSRHQWAGRAMKAENEVKDLLASKPAVPHDDEALRTLALSIMGRSPKHEENIVGAMNLIRNAMIAASTAPAQSCGDAEQADEAVTLPIMRAAFRVVETEGDPDPDKQRFHLRFTFRSMRELDAACDEWRAFSNAARAKDQS